MPRQRLEETTQKAIIAYVESVVPRSIVMAIPNAARRTLHGRPMNAVAGLKKGAPDLVMVLPGGRIVFCEVKSPKGKLSDDQFAMHGRLHALGVTCFVARSIDDVRHALAAIGVETQESE